MGKTQGKKPVGKVKGGKRVFRLKGQASATNKEAAKVDTTAMSDATAAAGAGDGDDNEVCRSRGRQSKRGITAMHCSTSCRRLTLEEGNSHRVCPLVLCGENIVRVLLTTRRRLSVPYICHVELYSYTQLSTCGVLSAAGQ